MVLINILYFIAIFFEVKEKSADIKKAREANEKVAVQVTDLILNVLIFTLSVVIINMQSVISSIENILSIIFICLIFVKIFIWFKFKRGKREDKSECDTSNE